jgi:hypothetical protein
MEPQHQEFLTPQQVTARLLGDPVLGRLGATCVLPAVRVSSEWRFRHSDLEAWIRKQSQRAADSHSAA